MLSSDSPLISAAALQAEQGQWHILEAGVEPSPEVLFASRGHVPGALLVDVAEDFSAPHAPYPFQCPDRDQFSRAASEAGLGNDAGVVIYDRHNGIWAARLWWLFRAFGHRRVKVLDGGLEGWKAAHLPLAFGRVMPEHGRYRAAALQPGYFVDLTTVQAISAGERPEQLLNVLRRPVFTGAELRYARAGHIPGSLHLPFAEVLALRGGCFRCARQLRQRFAMLDSTRPIVTYCGSGITAAGMALALAVAGRDDVAVYDGSLSEWSAHAQLPLSILDAD